MFIYFRRQITAMAVVACSAASAAAGQPLTLDEAVSKALASGDPYLSAPAQAAAAMRDHAVADGQLPDPKVRFAFANWPTNSFSYTQEPMTQVQLGLSQAFPRGDSRRLAREKRMTAAEGVQFSSALRRLEVMRDTRLAWLDLYFWQASVARIEASRQAIAELITVTESGFASGMGKSQDIFRAQMELALLEDRLLDVAQKTDTAKARLARWLGQADVTPVGQPVLRHPENAAVIKEMLAQHPAAQIQRAQVETAEKDIALAREGYKPGWSVNVGYGARGGDRADFASVGVTMDVPLFTGKRQDKRLSAAKRNRQAEQLGLSSTLLDLERKLMTTHAQ